MVNYKNINILICIIKSRIEDGKLIEVDKPLDWAKFTGYKQYIYLYI